MADEIKTAFDTAFRDYATDGVPSSGANKVKKSEVRAAGEIVQTAVDELRADITEIESLVSTGRQIKADVRVATTANGTLASAFDNGSTIDGLVLATNDRILIKNQTDATVNGIYVVQASGAPVRATDADTGAELLGATVFVRVGTVNKGITYTCSNTAAPSLGVDNITFVLTDEQNVSVPSALDAMRAKGSNIASAATVDLATSTGDLIDVTGSVAVTSFGTMTAGIERTVRFTAGTTLTASANIITPDGGDMTVPANGTVTLKSLGSGVWLVTSFPGDVAAERLDRRALIDTQSDNTGPYKHEFKGEDGFLYAGLGETESSISGITVRQVDGGGVERTGVDRFMIPGDGDEPPAEITLNELTSLNPYYGPAIYGVDGEEFDIHLQNILSDRRNAELANLTMIGVSGESYSAHRQVKVRPDKLGATANLIIRRNVDDGSKFADLPLEVFSASKTDLATETIALLNVGDSIMYRGGGAQLKFWLDTWAPALSLSFIGTLTGEDDLGESGQLGEGKPGHCLGDLTYAFTNRVSPLAPGDEAAYLAMSVTDKRLKNPMLRASTGGDDPEDIVNGYVLDFEFYRTRWAVDLATPTILLNEYGRNDISNLPDDAVYQHFYDNDMLIYRRWFADYPTAPVVRVLPNTARDHEEDYLWQKRGVQAMKGILEARAVAIAGGMTNILFVPAGAAHSIDGGFDLTPPLETPDGFTGAYIREIADPIHPTGGSRAAFWRQTAAGIACAATGDF
jgi:hypothetical protein